MVENARAARARHSRETRGKFGGGGARNYVISIPGVEAEDWYSIKRPEKNEIDIIEFKITQEWYPRLRCRGGGTCGDIGMEVGQLDYKLEIPVHQNIGPQKKDHLCPMDAFEEPCPVCEEKFAKLEANNNKWDRDTMGPLNASWRCFYNIYDYSENRFRPWHVAYNTFEKILQDALDRYKAEQGNEIFPWAWDVGWGMEFYATEESLGGGSTYNKPQMPTFFERDPYTMADVEQMHGFDKFLKISSYDEIAKDFYGMSDGITSSADGVADQSAEQPTVRTRSRRGAAPPQETAVREEPTVRTRSRAEEPPAESRPAPWNVGEDVCPFGHRLGYDCNQKGADCKSCAEEDFNKCVELNDKISKEGTPPPATEKPATTRRTRGPAPQEEAPTTTRRRRRG